VTVDAKSGGPRPRQHTVIGAATLPVPGRGEPVAVALSVVDQGVKNRRFGLIHDQPITRETAVRNPFSEVGPSAMQRRGM
jgi:hypothetical protein